MVGCLITPIRRYGYGNGFTVITCIVNLIQDCLLDGPRVGERNPAVCAKLVSIVDDDEHVRHATSSLVRSLGWDVADFESAMRFLASDVIEKTGCLLSDVKMPEMTGVELQNYLNEKKIFIPTIFVTAYPSERLREQLVGNGALCLLEKPVDVSELTSWLARILPAS